MSVLHRIYEETRGVLTVFLRNIIRDAVVYADFARRKTVVAADVVHALRRNGRTLYGALRVSDCVFTPSVGRS